MARIVSMHSTKADSEMEEGEIVDELDDLSDISSEEEFLLRQRLQVLENYNNVLERKEAKRSSHGKSFILRDVQPPSYDLSDVSTTNFEESFLSPKLRKDMHVKNSNPVHHKHKRKDVFTKSVIVKGKYPVSTIVKNRIRRKKPLKPRKKEEPKVNCESSDESDYEYRNKRRKLANAVIVQKNKTDSSLKARLMKMLHIDQHQIDSKKSDTICHENTLIVCTDGNIKKCNIPKLESDLVSVIDQKPLPLKEITKKSEISELIDISTDDDVQIVASDVIDGRPKTDSAHVENKVIIADKSKIEEVSELKSEEGSDEDLELLRQYALKTKPSTRQGNICKPENETDLKNVVKSEDEDSDTAELRLICLRSALLKKAIEMKQKQKLRKRLSQSSSLYDDIVSNEFGLSDKANVDNNTDIESVDMDIGSDGPDHDEKELTFSNVTKKNDKSNYSMHNTENDSTKNNLSQREDDPEEDEDLLRAKLLTSLSKNLPLLIDPVDNYKMENDVDSSEKTNQLRTSTESNPLRNTTTEDQNKVENKFIINTGGSDTESEHEATESLTKMHIKLSEKAEFQQKLDLFLKSARMEVETSKLPDVVQKSQVLPLPITPEKFVPKTVNHLPKSEQIEYKNLVKRMAELEKIKQVRQMSMNIWQREILPTTSVNETAKARNISINTTKPVPLNNLDEQIALSRKSIAEESAKVLRLKEEEKKLIQKRKIVATELRNLTTAITFNKKQQKTAQSKLTKIRMHHQMLLKRTLSANHPKNNFYAPNKLSNKTMIKSKLQKENEPLNPSFTNPSVLKSVRVSVVNDYKEESGSDRKLSVQIDVSKNTKKVIATPCKANDLDVNNTFVGDGNKGTEIGFDGVNDYQSPLQALSSGGWTGDPNGVLCPFEVGGSCKDVNCKYLHPKPKPSPLH